MHGRKKVAFHTLGCKLNFAETSTVARQFDNEGFSRTEFSQKADVYVINTCSVTENADKECRELVRRVQRQNPEAFVCITGCYAQLRPTEVASIPGVDLVAGSAEKFNLLPLLGNLQKKEVADIHSCETADSMGFLSAWSAGDRTRAFLKIQDGCDYPCTYCTIPKARGNSRSDSIANVLTKANEIAAKGCKEVVLTGVNVGDFGKSAGESRHNESLFDLLLELEKIQGIERYRISSIEPNLLSPDIIRLVAGSNKFMPHFHVPLQSGSNKILGLMRRRYRRELYAERVSLIKELMPNAGIGADVIVGFPGETEEDFEETFSFIKDLEVTYLHVFTFSARPDTAAYNMQGQIPNQIKQQRNKKLRMLSAKKSLLFASQYAGSEAHVLFESENKNGFLHGYTPNYIRVGLPYDEKLTNSIKQVNLKQIDASGIYQVVLQNNY